MTGRRRTLIAAIVAFVVLLVVGVTGFFWLLDRAADDVMKSEDAQSRWAEGITPDWMADQMGLGVPEDATDRQAAYRVKSRWDIGLLTFTLPRQEADAYLDPLRPKGTEMIRNFHPAKDDSRQEASFEHLGLPEPDTLVKNMLIGGLCPGDTKDPNGAHLKRCVDLYAHQYTPDRTRIYVRSHFEPGISPLPAAPAG
ncbi:hypothetical protein [Streptomyces sp. NPDC046821]|uniref:hypothetical protein n=1 Tax=Streptomyces sp. NPDC046821 TaxID=3154702 RepID=UPI00340D5691